MVNHIPKIKDIKAFDNYNLRVIFDNNIEKDYDCSVLFDKPIFHPLTNRGFFLSVKVDSGGYGISWNEDIDLSEYELWTNGKLIFS